MQKNDINQTVTSVGNSWVVCRSKSHFGRIYYFNTLTGEAAWNLSELEIEKAKKTTKIIENSGVRIEGCPEPKDPPQDHSSQPSSFDTPVYKQHIGNPSTLMNNNNAHLIPPFTGVQCSCSHLNPMNNVGLHIPVASGLNPNIWNVPVAPQHLLANSIPNLVSQTQSTSTIPYNKIEDNELKYVHTTSVPLNKRFGTQCTGNNNFSITGTKKINTWTHNKSGVRNLFYKNRLSFKNDLRQLLSSKRHTNSTNNTDEQENDSPNSRFTHGRRKSISDTKDPDDSTSPKEVHDTAFKIKFNLSGLRNIAKNSIHEDFWYIVSDANVLINHHGFVKILLDSDEKCRLMVPEHVIAEIRNASRSSNFRVMNHARRAMSFLSQSIRANLAAVAKDPSFGNTTGKSFILDCCLKLMNENFHIVLLCNDKELQSDEKAISIPMFTVNEMKSFLRSSVADDETQTRVLPFSNERLIKITIPNNTTDAINSVINHTTLEKITSTPVKKTVTNHKTNMISIGIQTNDIPHVKTPVDVEVQTEFCSEQLIQTCNSESNTLFATNSETIDNIQDKINAVASQKRKEIRLNRSVSHQPSMSDENAEKRNFKWRRKRPRCLVDSTDEKEINMSENSTDSSSFNKKLRHDDHLEPAKQCPQQVDHLSHNLGNTNNLADNVIVEETSTSGVISNSASNNDSESESSMNAQEATAVSCPVKGSENIKNVMFEITSQAMEEHLKTRCDEWVSRFIQIMEEVLTQILQKDNLSFSNALPPPWTLHEATQCIKMKFCKDCDIVDAANKLSEVLLKISDKKGAINLDMNPSNYMEMYSYGVYLIDTLQAVINDSEDLQTASESLAKLLNDIQNSNEDISHNDSFVDITHEAVGDISDAVNTETEEKSTIVSNVDSYVQKQRREQLNAKLLDSPSKYNLRSQWKRTIQNDRADENEVRAISPVDAECTFFTTLRLKKKNNCENDDAIDINESYTQTRDPPISEIAELNNKKDNELTDGPTVNEEKSLIIKKQSSEPKIIRNFTKCLDFEEKLMNKEREMLGLDSSVDPYLDYEYTEDEYVSQDEYDYFEGNEDNDEYAIHNENRSPRVYGHYNFKCVIRRVLREIREAFLVVYSFCEESQKRLSAPSSAMDNAAILLKATETHSYITNLCTALNSISTRDAETSDHDIAAILNSEDIAGIKLDKSDLEEYRALVAKCVDQGNVLRKTVKTIIDHTKR